ncbi:MAG: DUF4837 family protein [Salinivirgaceae bacterium]|nr:DUF4837 family protein [Salinivirgaceae bacterium]
MKFTKLITLIFIIIIAFGCKQEKVKRNLLPGVSGSAGEVLIVIDKKYWDKEPGSAFKSLLREDTPGLPQREPLFNVIHIPRKSFSELFRIHRNVIVTNISNTVEKPGVSVEYDRWAKPQMIISIVAPDLESYLEIYDRNEQKILALLLKAEKDRLAENYKKYEEKKVGASLKKSTGVELTIPKGYTYDLDTNNFVWISHETPEISQGIFVYHRAYSDTSQLTTNALIDARNEVLKRYVGGDGTGTYMTTELEVFPQFRSYTLNGKYTAELRGLWKVEGDFMGGPFLSISQVDEVNDRLITVEGYVYAPKFNKRDYVRQLEAILYSIKIGE